MQLKEHRKHKIMHQWDANAPADQQIRWLTEEYRNLYDEVEKLRDLVNRHDEVING